jgi:hypothetical protein
MVAIAAAAGMAAVASATCHAEVRPGETQGLGLMGAQTPDLLKAVAADPYRAPAEPACETIPAELKALEGVLGADTGEKRKRGPRQQAVSLAGGAVRSMVPYRGVVRFLTRADQRDHALMDATMAGYARRGFLRGLEANLHCSGASTTLAAMPDLTPELPDATVTVAYAERSATPVSYTAPPPRRPPPEEQDGPVLTVVDEGRPLEPNDAPADPGR